MMKSAMRALTKRVEGLSRRQNETPSPKVVRAVSSWTIQQTEPQPRRLDAMTREEWEALSPAEQVNAFVEGRIVI